MSTHGGGLSAMRGLYYTEYGEPEDVLQLGEVPALPMGPDTVAIDVVGAGINPVDWKIMNGYLQGAFETVWPIIPGWDVSGVVTAVGPAVTGFTPGQQVFAYARMDMIGRGTAAAKVVLPERVVAPAPTAIDLVSASAVPLAGLTAYQLVNRVDPQPGQTVLVLNASGGVGQFASQLAALRGARVIGTSSPRNHDYLRDLGIEPVAYGDTEVDAVRELAPEGVDVALDLIGGSALDTIEALLTPSGRFGSITDASDAVARGGAYVFVHPSQADLTELARLIDAGSLTVDVAATYGFDEAAAAYRRVKEGHVRGKVILTP
jgi:NADPH:quinone reductase-like Zn-dependent oxidoreductase